MPEEVLSSSSYLELVDFSSLSVENCEEIACFSANKIELKLRDKSKLEVSGQDLQIKQLEHKMLVVVGTIDQIRKL
ncbi:MAG: YabP family [Bacillota bacterium]